MFFRYAFVADTSWTRVKFDTRISKYTSIFLRVVAMGTEKLVVFGQYELVSIILSFRTGNVTVAIIFVCAFFLLTGPMDTLTHGRDEFATFQIIAEGG